MDAKLATVGQRKHPAFLLKVSKFLKKLLISYLLFRLSRKLLIQATNSKVW